MKSVFDFLQMDHKHMEHELCHPRRQANFDNGSIQKKIEQIRSKKQELKVQAARKKQQLKQRKQRLVNFPFQQILEEALQPLEESTSLIIKQKLKFVQDKVYIGTKNNVNNQYISKVIDSSQAKPALKYELSLFMEDMISNLQSDIVAGEYQVFNKKEVVSQKYEQAANAQVEPSAKLIQIKKVEIAQKIEELRGELTKTQLEQEKLSPIPSKNRSPTFRSASVNGQMVSSSTNFDDYSIKSQRTKEAESFVKNLQKQQGKQRKLRKKREQQIKKLSFKLQQQKKQFQGQIKNQRHQQLKKKFQNQRRQKMTQFQKANKSKAEYENFLSQYRKKKPLFKQKDLQFNKMREKQQRQKMMSVLTQIKQAKRSIDINQLKQHQKKYKIVRSQFQTQKLANLKHRQKEIYLRHKHDKLYFRGRYHSMIKEELQKQPQDPAVIREELLKRKKQYGEKVKKEFVPSKDQKKQKQLEQLIQKINRNKPNVQSKDTNKIGNKYLSDLYILVKEMKDKGKVKVQLPQQIKPRYKNYLDQLKSTRNYSTISYNKQDPEQLEKQAFRLDQNARRKQKLLSFSEDIDIARQLKKIDQLDMQLLKSAQIKTKLLQKYYPRQQNQYDEDQ